MEWIRINTNKLKIMLTAEDAKRYALRVECAGYSDASTRRAFRNILTDIKKASGFDATEDRVYIQLYPSKEGGCELFITKTGLGGGEVKEAIHKIPYGDVGEETASVRHATFSFEKTEHLLKVCRCLLERRFAGRSAAFAGDEGRLWLLLSWECPPYCRIEEYAFIGEYGKIEDTELATLLLAEHGKQICLEGAVETLGVL
jgi:negative regulator of genetic competence, sporulation and motility